MSNKQKNDGTPSFGDPYKIFNLEYGATNEEISKSYRRLALKYHPDKQRNNKSNTLSPKEIQNRFHALTEAKAFLLDSEHSEARSKYDAKLKSNLSRQKEEQEREQHMSLRRKRMRDELRAKEAQMASEYVSKKVPNTSASTFKSKSRSSTSVYQARKEELQREGRRMRESHAQSQHEKGQQTQQAKNNQQQLQERQIRLKWSRSKITISPSEDSIAQLFSQQFGQVETVEFLGKKGNLALVTFQNASSCTPCVNHYQNSDEMRATYVGKRKEQEKEKEEMDLVYNRQTAEESLHRDIDDENLKERHLRQAAEREALLRAMEQEKEEEKESHKQQQQHSHSHPSSSVNVTKEASLDPNRTIRRRYPPLLPIDKSEHPLTPFQHLEQLEERVLPLCVSTPSKQ